MIRRILWKPEDGPRTLHIPAYITPSIWRKWDVGSDSRMAWLDIDITANTLTVTRITPIPMDTVQEDEERGDDTPATITAARPEGLLVDHNDWLL